MYGLFKSTLQNSSLILALEAFIVGQIVLFIIMEVVNNTDISSRCKKYFSEKHNLMTEKEEAIHYKYMRGNIQKGERNR